MSFTNPPEVFRVVERAGTGNRLWLRGAVGDRVTHIAVSGYQGPSLPETMTHPELRQREGTDSQAWRLICDQGQFDFKSKTVESIETRPALFAALHRPFALSTTDRMAVRLLLALLRLPGGAKLLRFWHARRSA